MVPDVPVDVILACGDYCSTAEVNSLVITKAQRRQQLQEAVQGEQHPATLCKLLWNLEVELEGVDETLPVRGPVSEYPDVGGNGPVGI